MSQDEQKVNQAYSVALIVAALLIAVPSALAGLVLGVGGILVVLTREIDSTELWLSALSYLAMASGGIITLSGLIRRRRKQTSAGLMMLALGWAGASWDRHRGEFTEWPLVVAIVCLVVSVLTARSNSSTDKERS